MTRRWRLKGAFAGATHSARNQGRRPPRHRRAAPRHGDLAEAGCDVEGVGKLGRHKVPNGTIRSPNRGPSMALPKPTVTAPFRNKVACGKVYCSSIWNLGAGEEPYNETGKMIVEISPF